MAASNRAGCVIEFEYRLRSYGRIATFSTPSR